MFQPKFETLEDRSVPATGVYFDMAGVLVIEGTNGIDAISVNAYNAAAVTVRLNGVNYGPFDTTGTHIKILGLDGADVMNLSGYVPMEVHGGAGNDSIFGGSGDDIIYGDEGNDYITAGIGNDVIIGGLGKDTVQGGNGLDIVTGNDVDKMVYDYATLRLTMNDWVADPNSAMVTALYFAQVDDLQNDSLTGGLGRDAFLTIPGDVITDFKVMEGDKKVFP